jgi:hypothetical protein
MSASSDPRRNTPVSNLHIRLAEIRHATPRARTIAIRQLSPLVPPIQRSCWMRSGCRFRAGTYELFMTFFLQLDMNETGIWVRAAPCGCPPISLAPDALDTK